MAAPVPVVKLRERQRQARGEAILEAAFALIVEQGYDALTMEALAARVGISRQTLYHHFASREDITLRAVLTLMERGIAAIKAIDSSLPPVERLERIVRGMLESRFQPATAALVKVRYALMPVKAHPDYQRAFERRADTLAQIVAAAQTAGELRADLPPRLVVQMLLGLINLGSSSAFTAFVSVGVIALAVSYAMPIGISLWHKRREVSHAQWNCGPIIGPIVNVVALLWITFELVLFSMPTALPVTLVTMNYASVVLVGFMAIAAGWYAVYARTCTFFNKFSLSFYLFLLFCASPLPEPSILSLPNTLTNQTFCIYSIQRSTNF